MSNRLAIGQRASGVYGFYVSKPTKDVLFCTDDELLLSTNRESIQVLYGGLYVTTSTDTGPLINITVPDVGYIPRVIVHGPAAINQWSYTVAFTSNTNFTVRQTNFLNPSYVNNWFPNAQLRYVALGIPL